MLALEEHPQPEHREVDTDHVPVDEEQEEERWCDDNVLQDSILAGPDESTHLHGLIDQEEARYRKEGCGGEIVSVQDGIGQDAADKTHRIDEDAHQDGILHERIHVRYVRSGEVRIEQLGLEDGHDVAVDVTSPVWDVEPDSKRIDHERKDQYVAPRSLRSQDWTTR